MTTIELEKRIANKVIRKALDKGYCISVNDGGAYPVKRSTSFKEISDALASSDGDILIIRDVNHGHRIGFVELIWGNGEDVISDHSDNAEINELVAQRSV